VPTTVSGVQCRPLALNDGAALPLVVLLDPSVYGFTGCSCVPLLVETWRGSGAGSVLSCEGGAQVCAAQSGADVALCCSHGVPGVCFGCVGEEIDRQAGGRDRQADGGRDRQAGRQADRQADRQTDTQAGRQASGWAGVDTPMPTQLMLLPLLSLLRCYCCCFLVRIITQGTPLAAVLAPTLSVTAIALLALACVTAAWRRSRVSACAHGKPDVPPASTAPPASTNVGAAMHKKAAPGFSSNNVTLVLTDVQVWVHAAAHLLLHTLFNLAYMSSQNPMPCQAKTLHKGHVQTPSFLLTKPLPPPHLQGLD
jgi:hypothetical protein